MLGMRHSAPLTEGNGLLSTETVYESNSEKLARLTGKELAQAIGTRWTRDERDLARHMIKALASGGDIANYLLGQSPAIWVGAKGSLISRRNGVEQPIVRLSSEKTEQIFDIFVSVSMEAFPELI